MTHPFHADEPYLLYPEDADDDDDEAPDGMIPIEAVEMLGAMTSYNADQAAHISNILIKSAEDKADDFARAHIAIYDMLAEIPDHVLTVQVQQILFKAGHNADRADDWLNRAKFGPER